MEKNPFAFIDLNIGENYLENWEVYQAIRELIANALDEQQDGNIQIIEKNENTHIIKDFGDGLKIENFIMKGSNKFNDDTTIGKFGIGLKDALGVLNNNKINVEIITSEYKFKFYMKEKSEKINLKTLHVYIYKNDDKDFKGTEVILKKCAREHMKKAKNEFLKFKSNKINIIEETKNGHILEKEDNSKAHIYVNGMKISEDDKLRFSYNIKIMSPTLKKGLNRERKYVGREAYKTDIEKILLKSKEKSVLNVLENQLIEFNNGFNFDEIKWKNILIKTGKYIESKYKNVLFITDEFTKINGHNLLYHQDDLKIITVPLKAKNILNKEITMMNNENIDKRIIDNIKDFLISNNSKILKALEDNNYEETVKKSIVEFLKVNILYLQNLI